MTLKSWLQLKRGRGAGLANYLKVPQSFVSAMASGEKEIPLRLMTRIEVFTQGAVLRMEMCPDDWQDIWPELAQASAGQMAVVVVENVATAQGV